MQLVENSRWQPGKKAWGAIHRGRTYLFAGPEEQRRFLANPDRYAPVSSGDDVVLLLEQGRSVSGYREHGLQFDGHVYLFAGEGTLEKFRSNPRYYCRSGLASAAADISNGVRTVNLAFRVQSEVGWAELASPTRCLRFVPDGARSAVQMDHVPSTNLASRSAWTRTPSRSGLSRRARRKLSSAETGLPNSR